MPKPKSSWVEFSCSKPTDLNHAIQLMSKHPGVKAGPFKIRPAADLAEMIWKSEQRRAGAEGEPQSGSADSKNVIVRAPRQRRTSRRDDEDRA